MRMFNFAFAQHKALKKGSRIRCYGTITHGPSGKEMIHPQYQVFESTDSIEVDKSLTPVYASTSKLQQGRLRKIISGAISYCEINNLFEEEKVHCNHNFLIESFLLVCRFFKNFLIFKIYVFNIKFFIFFSY